MANCLRTTGFASGFLSSCNCAIVGLCADVVVGLRVEGSMMSPRNVLLASPVPLSYVCVS